jgi:alkaline phosphatase D
MKKFLYLILFSAFFSVNAQYISHGPVVGAVSHNSARIYVRTFNAQPFELQLDDDAAFGSPISIQDSTIGWRDSSNIINVHGLTAYTKYYYRLFFQGVEDTTHGYFKTFPLPGTKGNYTMAVLSCQEFGTYNAFNALYNLQPELVFHTGDWTYPDYQLPWDWRMNYATLQLSYKRRYTEPKMPKVIRTTVFDYVVDNHDGMYARTNNSSTYFYVDSLGIHNVIDFQPTPVGAFENMMKAYDEYFPKYNLADSLNGMYHSYKYGNIEVFFVDVRNCGNAKDSTFRFNDSTNLWEFNPYPGQTLLGQQQMAWLKNGLANSTADWKFIVSGVMFNRNYRKIIDYSTALQNFQFNFGGGLSTGLKLGHALSDNWAGYPAEQDSLLSFLKDNNIRDVIALTGHVHTNVMDNGKNSGIPELNTGPVAGYGPELTYYIDSMMQILGIGRAKDSLWNGGGQGIENTNFKSGFGKINIYGNDSLVMCIVDEDDQIVSCMNIPHSSKVTTINEIPKAARCVIDKLYPNPTADKLNISYCGDFTPEPNNRYAIIDIAGRVLLPLTRMTGNTIDISNLPEGNYLMIYDYGTYIDSKTFVIAR